MPSAGGPLVGRALVEVGVALAIPLMKRTLALHGRGTHCNDLVTARSRPVSGFTSADKAECCLQFHRPREVNSLRDTSEKLGVSLFGLAGNLASEVNLLYDQQ
jgi:hypothetical protein